MNKLLSSNNMNPKNIFKFGKKISNSKNVNEPKNIKSKIIENRENFRSINNVNKNDKISINDNNNNEHSKNAIIDKRKKYYNKLVNNNNNLTKTYSKFKNSINIYKNRKNENCNSINDFRNSSSNFNITNITNIFLNVKSGIKSIDIRSTPSGKDSMIRDMKELHIITEKALNSNRDKTPSVDSLDSNSKRMKKNILNNYTKNIKNELLIKDNSDFETGKICEKINNNNNTKVNAKIKNNYIKNSNNGNKLKINIENKNKSQIINIININGNYSMDQTKKKIISNISNLDTIEDCVYEISNKHSRNSVIRNKQNKIRLSKIQKYDTNKKHTTDNINNNKNSNCNNYIKEYIN